MRPRNFWLLFIGVAMYSATLAQMTDATHCQQFVAAVEAAAAVDAYHARCRGDGSGRRMDNLNKLLVSTQRITVLTVEDECFPEQNYRRAQPRMEQDFIIQLEQIGGCAAAKAAGMVDQFTARYNAALAAIRAIP
ncbi:hypothetical protein [Chromatium okenii]|uniref:hypothetical protein n=1 Tax=Chromatium okenii TaxID=61644 RepID=UPI0026EA87BE|nr:hypothetical protein [Chromatium okenii]MBV5308088.1 hypothetical protein [Chromatium okenii]